MRFGYGLLTAQRHPDDPRPWADLYREAVEYGELADRAGLDPSVQREAFDVLVEEVVPLLRG